jgi:hypothetical protein
MDTNAGWKVLRRKKCLDGSIYTKNRLCGILLFGIIELFELSSFAVSHTFHSRLKAFVSRVIQVISQTFAAAGRRLHTSLPLSSSSFLSSFYCIAIYPSTCTSHPSHQDRYNLGYDSEANHGPPPPPPTFEGRISTIYPSRFLYSFAPHAHN